MTESDPIGLGNQPDDEWPDWFPPGCPPPAAVPAVGEFFRLVEGDDVVEEDFISHYERSLSGGRRFWKDDVQASSCSLFQDRVDADETRRAIGSLRDKRVARGSISGSGQMQHTPSSRAQSHHSWWRPTGDHAWESFSVTP
ncbi:hypothetical protein FLP10_15170 [Agromyces intestinalis]|uniref:Uncharacterized protein n=1 Tax=Agromyces intestinalis TaxID=2592652 RepID=A0A5C1YK30_9MICO|nr:hypothetical protein [Agromyces intestinalis]QEO15620.1 hypothetical protein FLP10_15170 [Agromyces intestinalis]